MDSSVTNVPPSVSDRFVSGVSTVREPTLVTWEGVYVISSVTGRSPGAVTIVRADSGSAFSVAESRSPASQVSDAGAPTATVRESPVRFQASASRSLSPRWVSPATSMSAHGRAMTSPAARASVRALVRTRPGDLSVES